VLDAEQSQLGAIFACHKHIDKPAKERGMCAGWLHDQKQRGVPSIMLRLSLMQDDEAQKAFHAVHDGGHELFSAQEMCDANLEAIENGENPHRRER